MDTRYWLLVAALHLAQTGNRVEIPSNGVDRECWMLVGTSVSEISLTAYLNLQLTISQKQNIGGAPKLFNLWLSYSLRKRVVFSTS